MLFDLARDPVYKIRKNNFYRAKELKYLGYDSELQFPSVEIH